MNNGPKPKADNAHCPRFRKSQLWDVEYEGSHAQASWKGLCLKKGAEFDSFMQGKVADRLSDAGGTEDFRSLLRGLALTNFGEASLKDILDAEVPEERDWAVGEAFAEALLTESYGVRWPWNMARDKRNPTASLPGADIVGFTPVGSGFRLALGEVKTSAEERYPPQVMSGRGGMSHQIDTLATDLGIIYQLLKWLHLRCKGTDFETHFKHSVTDYCNSGNKAAALFGILIRDTQANELDLKDRGATLGTNLAAPASCNLVAVYLPHKITELPKRVKGKAVA